LGPVYKDKPKKEIVALISQRNTKRRREQIYV